MHYILFIIQLCILQRYSTLQNIYFTLQHVTCTRKELHQNYKHHTKTLYGGVHWEYQSTSKMRNFHLSGARNAFWTVFFLVGSESGMVLKKNKTKQQVSK